MIALRRAWPWAVAAFAAGALTACVIGPKQDDPFTSGRNDETGLPGPYADTGTAGGGGDVSLTPGADGGPPGDHREFGTIFNPFDDAAIDGDANDARDANDANDAGSSDAVSDSADGG